MHSGKHYSFKEVIIWTRRDVLALLIIAAIPTVIYDICGCKWIAVPWLPIALLGTAVAFMVGFKNNASYDRLWEGRRIWGGIVNTSRVWGIMVKDFISAETAKTPHSEQEIKAIQMRLINRHIAWMTALRYQLRVQKEWEAIKKVHNAEYKKKWFHVAEQETKMEDELAKYLSPDELRYVMSKSNKATQIQGLQSKDLKHLHSAGLIDDFRHMEMVATLTELYNQQGAAERIKNFPYPRQYATLNLWFIKIFILLLPFGMLNEFQKLGDGMVYLSIPFSALAGWVFTTMEKIGESSENPFEGGPNDVPITSMARTIEIDLLEMFDQTDIPEPTKASHNILT